METNDFIHVRLPTGYKEDIKKYAKLDNRTMSGFITEAIRVRIEQYKRTDKSK